MPCTPRVPSPDVFEHRPVVHAERFGMGRYPKTFTIEHRPVVHAERFGMGRYPKPNEHRPVVHAERFGMGLPKTFTMNTGPWCMLSGSAWAGIRKRSQLQTSARFNGHDSCTLSSRILRTEALLPRNDLLSLSQILGISPARAWNAELNARAGWSFLSRHKRLVVAGQARFASSNAAS